MEILKNIILGIIQGFTEFLPVSSSGHLEIAKALFGDKMSGADSLLVTSILHAGTALSTIVIFRKDIATLFRGLFEWKWNDETKFICLIIVSMIPAAIVGVFFNKQLEAFFTGNLMFVGLMLVLTAILLFVANRKKDTTKDVNWFEATVVGISQAIATLPGLSRSGTTIATSLMLGIDKSKAARFSFLMVVPLILGQIILDGLKICHAPDLYASMSVLPLIAGFIASFLTGLIACSWMIQLVKKTKLVYFAYYCAIVGVVVVAWSLFLR